MNEVGQVTLNGSGNGTVQLSPIGPHEQWQPSLCSVKCSSNTNEAQCRIYAGPNTSDSNYVDGTVSGSTGDSTDRTSGYTIARTQTPYIWAVWSGGDAGAQATLVVNGTKTL